MLAKLQRYAYGKTTGNTGKTLSKLAHKKRENKRIPLSVCTLEESVTLNEILMTKVIAKLLELY